jgi:hypothetical protein
MTVIGQALSTGSPPSINSAFYLLLSQTSLSRIVSRVRSIYVIAAKSETSKNAIRELDQQIPKSPTADII